MGSEREPCKACEGSGLLYPSPFYEFVAWPYVVRLSAEHYRQGVPRSALPVLTGSIRPKPCPECGGVETVPPPVVVCFERKREDSDG